MMTIILKDKGQIHWNWVNKWDNPAPEQEPLIQLIRNLNSWRRHTNKFLCFGKMLKPYAISGYKNFSLVRTDSSTINYNSVLCSRWQSQDGETAQYLTNYLREPQVITIDLPKDKVAIMHITPFSDGKKLDHDPTELKIPPMSAVMIEFS
jgi:hypothetical protein